MSERLDEALASLARMYADAETDPPWGWPAVEAFEARHGVRLPEPYRSFIATVCAGGKDCGPPAYGLWPPNTGEHDWSDRPIVLDLPFPLTSAWIWEDDQVRADGVTVEDVWTRGIVPLGTEGCGQYWALVATGAHRGHVWNLTDVGAGPFGREFGYTSGASGFLGWVSHWFCGADWWDVPP